MLWFSTMFVILSVDIFFCRKYVLVFTNDPNFAKNVTPIVHVYTFSMKKKEKYLELKTLKKHEKTAHFWLIKNQEI